MDDDLKNLLQKASSGSSKIDLTHAIMSEIIAIEAKKQVDKKYLKRSWMFVGLAVLLAINLLYIFSFFQTSIVSSIDIYLPGFAQALIYFTFSGLIGWFLYQFNSLISLQFSHKA